MKSGDTSEVAIGEVRSKNATKESYLQREKSDDNNKVQPRKARELKPNEKKDYDELKKINDKLKHRPSQQDRKSQKGTERDDKAQTEKTKN